MTRRLPFVPVFVIAVVLMTAPGCKKDKEASMDEATRTRVQAVLAKADAFDGETDKTVSKCASCGLGMDGKSKHAITVAGYTMHFCSDMCREHFADGLSEHILAMKVPEQGGE